MTRILNDSLDTIGSGSRQALIRDITRRLHQEHNLILDHATIAAFVDDNLEQLGH